MNFITGLIKYAKKTPYFHLEGYMERYWLVPYTSAGSAGRDDDGTGVVPWSKPVRRILQTYIAARIHCILRSDEGRDPHDHPWPYLSVILRGRYYEERFTSDGLPLAGRWYGPGSIIYRPAGSWHKLFLEQGTTVWTLFVTGKYVNKWGFLTPKGKVNHGDYRKLNA